MTRVSLIIRFLHFYHITLLLNEHEGYNSIEGFRLYLLIRYCKSTSEEKDFLKNKTCGFRYLFIYFLFDMYCWLVSNQLTMLHFRDFMIYYISCFLHISCPLRRKESMTLHKFLALTLYHNSSSLFFQSFMQTAQVVYSMFHLDFLDNLMYPITCSLDLPMFHQSYC